MEQKLWNKIRIAYRVRKTGTVVPVYRENILLHQSDKKTDAEAFFSYLILDLKQSLQRKVTM